MAGGRQFSAETITNLNVATRTYINTAVSQLAKDDVVRARLMKKSKPVDGGTKIDYPLIVDKENVASVGKYDAYNLQPKEVLDKAQYDWKQVRGDMSIAKFDIEVVNAGKAKLIDLAETRVKNIQTSMSIKFAELIFNPVASMTADDFDSLVKIAATANNSVGGIDASVCLGGSGTVTQPFAWNPKIIDYSTAGITYTNLITPTSIYYIETLLRKLVSQLTVGADKPTLIVVSQGVWDAYEHVLKAQKQIDGKAKETDGGFLALMFRNIPVIADNNCPGGQLATSANDNSGIMMALNENYIGFKHASAYGSNMGEAGFRWTPWHELETQPVLHSKLEWAGTLGCDRRDRQGAVLGLPSDVKIYA